MGKTLHPTPYTPHPAPKKNFFSKPYIGVINLCVLCVSVVPSTPHTPPPPTNFLPQTLDS
ncbi:MULTISPECIES: hypothetical protein [unclassified Microcystis]|uniref:hypothetical protein n=1 Tax=unclassified Microcystis TaxID=2643300 RepID=UPI00030E22F3|nr:MULTISPECIES: hypothetical protein [unclassified Microcystis]MCZ8049191.1 hypothetical protein [Microcystis sp. LE19-41.2A]